MRRVPHTHQRVTYNVADLRTDRGRPVGILLVEAASVGRFANRLALVRNRFVAAKGSQLIIALVDGLQEVKHSASAYDCRSRHRVRHHPRQKFGEYGSNPDNHQVGSYRPVRRGYRGFARVLNIAPESASVGGGGRASRSEGRVSLDWLHLQRVQTCIRSHVRTRL